MRISKDTAFVIQAAGGLASMAAGTMYFREVVSKVCFDCCSGPNQRIGLTLAQSLLLASSFFGNGFNMTGKVVRGVVDVEGEEKAVAKAAKQHFSKDAAFGIEAAGGLASMAAGTLYIQDVVSKVCLDCCSGPTQPRGLSLAQSLLLAGSFFGNGMTVAGSLLRKVVTVQGDVHSVKETAKKHFN